MSHTPEQIQQLSILEVTSRGSTAGYTVSEIASSLCMNPTDRLQGRRLYQVVGDLFFAKLIAKRSGDRYTVTDLGKSQLERLRTELSPPTIVAAAPKPDQAVEVTLPRRQRKPRGKSPAAHLNSPPVEAVEVEPPKGYAVLGLEGKVGFTPPTAPATPGPLVLGAGRAARGFTPPESSLIPVPERPKAPPPPVVGGNLNRPARESGLTLTAGPALTSRPAVVPAEVPASAVSHAAGTVGATVNHLVQAAQHDRGRVNGLEQCLREMQATLNRYLS